MCVCVLVCVSVCAQDSRPTGTIPLAGNRVIRHLDDPKNNGTSFKFEIIGMCSVHCFFMSCMYIYL